MADAAREEWLIQLLLSAETYIQHDSEAMGMGYGLFRPANPNDFFPDAENTPEEHAAHKAACEAYDRGEYKDDNPSGWIAPNIHVMTAPWGPGAYTIRDEKAEELLAAIKQLKEQRNG